jgi:two-component system chemotaxis sensor kinase CheA
MNIRVGNSKYTLPTTSIHETFRAKEEDLLQDPEGNEMIIVRGNCYPILRIHKEFAVKTEITDFTQGSW